MPEKVCFICIQCQLDNNPPNIHIYNHSITHKRMKNLYFATSFFPFLRDYPWHTKSPHSVQHHGIHKLKKTNYYHITITEGPSCSYDITKKNNIDRIRSRLCPYYCRGFFSSLIICHYPRAMGSNGKRPGRISSK